MGQVSTVIVAYNAGGFIRRCPSAVRSGRTKFGSSDGTREVRLDEKLGGTVHLAIGMSYPETGGEIRSAVHLDMFCGLRRGGSLAGDGEELQRDNQFLR